MNVKTFYDSLYKCPECGGNVVLHNGEYKCIDCGLVLGPEYTYDYPLIHQQRSRVLSDSGCLGSFIGSYSSNFLRDTFGKPLINTKQKKYNRLRYYHKHNHYKSQTQRRYIEATRILEKINEVVKIPEYIQEKSLFYYKYIIKNNKKRWFKNHINLIFACTFITLRENMLPISLNDYVKALNLLGYKISKKTLLSVISKITEYYGIKLPSSRSEVYFLSYIHKLRFNEQLRKKLLQKKISSDHYLTEITTIGKKILEELNQSKRGGRNPQILAAAVIYAANRIYIKKYNKTTIITQSELSIILGIPAYSIRDHFLFLKKNILLKLQRKLMLAS
ncbi:MAG: transcription initiation factor IIB family protein [Candidatus Odinarchaeota archaeon]|nr:transcription initiation factor IIB family protein [Candidatus Odinarchaeota archaeon]